MVGAMRKGWRERALDGLARQPLPTVAAAALLLVALVTLLDWYSHAEIAAALGYLLPISLVAWATGRVGAVVCGAVCAGAWLAVDLLTHAHDMTPGLEVVNLIVLTVAFQLFGQLLVMLREQLDHERRLAHTDPLTSLHNRRAFWNATGREVARLRRQREPFSLAYIDVDGFKGVNDRFGHRAGDELLRRIAAALQQDLRQLDMVARLGGDEFVLLLPGTDVVGAARVVARLKKRLQRAAWRQSFEIDFSIGCLTVREAPKDVDTIVARADELMYTVKRSGRGQVRHDVMPEGAVELPAAIEPRGAGNQPRVAN